MGNIWFIEKYFLELHKVIKDIPKDDIDKAINILFEAWKNDKKIYTMGNGGSASTAAHFASDLVKTIVSEPGGRGIRALTPWDNIPLVSASLNDRPREDLFVVWLDTFYEARGVGIGISVHGGSGSDLGGRWSENLLRGIQYIKDRGGWTIGFSGFDGGPLADLADVCITVPVPEPSLGTPLVESLHVAIHHLIVFYLKNLIKEGGLG
mgnify:CR=1 FL=1